MRANTPSRSASPSPSRSREPVEYTEAADRLVDVPEETIDPYARITTFRYDMGISRRRRTASKKARARRMKAEG